MIIQECFLFLVRIFLGAVMVYHGWPKLTDLKATSKYFKKIGFKWPSVVALKVSLLEFAGGILIILGIFAELIAAMFIFEMMVVVFMRLATKKSFADYSYNLGLIFLSALVMLKGSGFFALLPIDVGYFLNWYLIALAVFISWLVIYLNDFSASPKQKIQA